MKTYFYKDYTLKQLVSGEAYDMAWDTLLADDEFYDIKDEYAEAGIALEEYVPENEDGVTTYTYIDESGARRFVAVKEKAVEEE